MATVQHGTQMTLAEYRGLEEAPPPSYDHQNLIDFLVSMINLFQMSLPAPMGWAVSGIGVVLGEQRAPTPDMVYLSTERGRLIQGSFVEGIPDLIVEALSTDRARDLVMKREWYAAAGIPEYWVLDPVSDALTILELSGDEYRTRASLRHADTLTTPTIPGFALPLAQVFNNPGRCLPIGRR